MEAIISVGDLRANNYKRAKEDFSNPADIIKLISYVDILAMNNNKNADELIFPFEHELGVKNLPKIKLLKKDINQLFFSLLEDVAEEELVLSAEIEDIIKATRKKYVENQKSQYRKEINSLKSKACERMDAANDLLRSANDLYKKLDLIEGDSKAASRIENIRHALKTTNWEFYEITGGYQGPFIHFVNKADIILKHSLPEQGIDYELNCGKYRAQINLNFAGLVVHKHTNAITNSTAIHPHVLDGKTPCWGNGSATYSKAATEGDISALLKLLDGLLRTYNIDNPYVSINNFSQLIKDRDDKGTGFKLSPKSGATNPSSDYPWDQDMEGAEDYFGGPSPFAGLSLSTPGDLQISIDASGPSNPRWWVRPSTANPDEAMAAIHAEMRNVEELRYGYSRVVFPEPSAQFGSVVYHNTAVTNGALQGISNE